MSKGCRWFLVPTTTPGNREPPKKRSDLLSRVPLLPSTRSIGVVTTRRRPRPQYGATSQGPAVTTLASRTSGLVLTDDAPGPGTREVVDPSPKDQTAQRMSTVPEEDSVPEPPKVASSPATRQRVWRPEQIEQAAALHKAGRSVQKIADELGLTRSTTRRLLVRAGRVQEASEDAIEDRRLRLRRLAGHLERGLSFPAAAERAGVTVEAARALIRQARELLPEPLPKSLLRQATSLKARLVGDDVRAAALAEGVDPWWALLLLILAGFEPGSMQPQRQPEMVDRIEQMAARRAAGATFEQIGEEFGVGRERARRLLLATGQWKPTRSARRASP